jgi:hypothetical protein
MAIECQQIGTKSAGDTELVAVDFSEYLDTGETLTGTPTVVEVTTTALTLASKAVSSTSLVILGRTVTAAEAVQWLVSGGTAGTRYKMRVTCSTTSTPARTVQRDVWMDVV